MQPQICEQNPPEQQILSVWPKPQLSGSSMQRSLSASCAQARWQVLVEGWHTSLMQI